MMPPNLSAVSGSAVSAFLLQVRVQCSLFSRDLCFLRNDISCFSHLRLSTLLACKVATTR